LPITSQRKARTIKEIFSDRCGWTTAALKQTNQHKNMTLPLLAEMSGSIHVGLAALGAAIGVGLIGMGAASAVGRNPGAATPILVQAILAIAFAEAIVFYALFLVH
jgi:F-type H+-transporting ATPase subunit c